MTIRDVRACGRLFLYMIIVMWIVTGLFLTLMSIGLARLPVHLLFVYVRESHARSSSSDLLQPHIKCCRPPVRADQAIESPVRPAGPIRIYFFFEQGRPQKGPRSLYSLQWHYTRGISRK